MVKRNLKPRITRKPGRLGGLSQMGSNFSQLLLSYVSYWMKDIYHLLPPATLIRQADKGSWLWSMFDVQLKMLCRLVYCLVHLIWDWGLYWKWALQTVNSEKVFKIKISSCCLVFCYSMVIYLPLVWLSCQLLYLIIMITVICRIQNLKLIGNVVCKLLLLQKIF